MKLSQLFSGRRNAHVPDAVNPNGDAPSVTISEAASPVSPATPSVAGADYSPVDREQFIAEEREFLREKYLLKLPSPYAKLLTGSPAPWEAADIQDTVNSFISDANLPGQDETLLVISHAYPTLENPYPNGFVHRRIKAYQARGVNVVVAIANPNLALEIREYDGVKVLSGKGAQLTALLKTVSFASYAVHFPTRYLWTWIEAAYGAAPKADYSRWVMFIHGFESRRWIRSADSFPTNAVRQKNIEATFYKQAFFRDLLALKNGPSSFVFVSEFLRECAELDMEVTFPDERTHIIHNVIDTDLFSYQPKDPEQRFRILWLRSAGTMSYAPDLAVRALKIIKQSAWWDRVEVAIYGDGQHFQLFEDEFASDSNVRLHRGFLNQQDIPTIQRDYGIYLTPSRFDTQGVGRDEAMAVGLVPVTNKAAAIPEFVDEKCAVLVDPEDAASMAAGMIELFENPDVFLEKSAAAARQVRALSGPASTVDRELKLLQLKSGF